MQNRRRNRKNPYRSIIIDCMVRYKEMKKTGGKTSKKILDAIDVVMDNVRKEEGGDVKCKAIEMLYINRNKDKNGAALDLYADKRTLTRWTNYIINKVCIEAELIDIDDESQ